MASQNTSYQTEAELHGRRVYNGGLDLFFDSPNFFDNLLRDPNQSDVWERFITGLVPPGNFSLPMTEMNDEMCARELVVFTERWGSLGFRRVIEEFKSDTIVPLPLFLDYDSISDRRKALLATLYEQNWGLAGTRLLRYYKTILAVRMAHEHK